MKAICKTRPEKGADVVDVTLRPIRPGEVLVRVHATALCKSDIDVYNWTELVARSNFPIPNIMGHEFAGEVVEAGSDVHHLRPGDHVCGETHLPCGTCHVCRIGRQHICTNRMGVLGRSADGCFTEYIILPAGSAMLLDPAMDYRHGALMEPFCTAIHSLSKAPVSGKTVGVMGCGTIGLMTVELAKILGASQVVAVSTTRAKLDFALAHGADLAIDNVNEDMRALVAGFTDGQGLDVIIDDTGNHEVFNQSLDMTVGGGTVVGVGFLEGTLVIPEFMRRVILRELKVTGIYGRHMYETWETAAAVLRSGRIDLEPYIAADLPLAEFDEALRLFPRAIGRIILHP